MNAFERARLSIQKSGMTTKKAEPIFSDRNETEHSIGKPIVDETSPAKVDIEMQKNKEEIDEELERMLQRAKFLEESEKFHQEEMERIARFTKPKITEVGED